MRGRAVMYDYGIEGVVLRGLICGSACFSLRVRVFALKRLSTVVPLVLRVYVLCVMSRVRASRFDWSRKRRTLHAFTCVARLWASRAFLNCECRMMKDLARLIVVSFRVFGACGWWLLSFAALPSAC